MLAVAQAPSADDPLEMRRRALVREVPRSSVAGVATRVMARTFEYEIRPRRSVSEIFGNVASACATRTYSRAVPGARFARQLSHCAYDVAPAQPSSSRGGSARSGIDAGGEFAISYDVAPAHPSSSSKRRIRTSNS